MTSCANATTHLLDQFFRKDLKNKWNRHYNVRNYVELLAMMQKRFVFTGSICANEALALDSYLRRKDIHGQQGITIKFLILININKNYGKSNSRRLYK